MLDFIRHIAPELISNKKSATFDNSTLWKLIPSIGSIPSKVASQQSLSPFSPTGKCTLILADTVYFTLPKINCAKKKIKTEMKQERKFLR